MAETKSCEELATELTIEYVKTQKKFGEPEEIEQIWCGFYKTIKFKFPPKKEESKE